MPRFLLVLLTLAACSKPNPVIEGDVFDECFDGADNDADGLLDCEDPDCMAWPECGGIARPGTLNDSPGNPGTGTNTGSASGSASGSATGSATGTATGGNPSCLDVDTMTMESVFEWDAARGQIVSYDNPFAGIVSEPSYFQVNFGPPYWTGDTSQPGPPANWCFIRWNLDGLTNTGGLYPYWLEHGGISTSNAITNCGQESTPGANDMVNLCGYFFYYDPITDFSPFGWSFHNGGPIDLSVAQMPSYLYPYGYTPDEIWGSEIRGAIFAQNVETLTWGWKVDANGNVQLDASGMPIRWKTFEQPGSNGLQSGVYTHWVPWIFDFN